MMSDWKTGLKLVRYAYQVKINLVFAVFFFIIGIFLFCLGEEYIIMGAAWSLLGVLYVNHLLFSLEFAGIIASSPKRTVLAFSTQDMTVAVEGILVYTILIGIEEIKTGIFLKAERKELLLTAFLMLFLLLLYIGAAYRLFVFGMIMLCALAVLCPWAGFTLTRLVSLHTGEIYLIGFVLILIGIALNCIIRRAIYRMPMSKLAAGGGLRKYL